MTDSDPSNEKRAERVEDLSIPDLNATEIKKRSARGVVLVPQPSDSPADPLNWPTWKKALILTTVSLAAFIGLAQALSTQAGFFLQAELYHKTPISAAAAGLATGPLLWTPLAQRLGRSSLIFWTTVGACACSIWAACMTRPTNYVPFVISRWLGGTFGACPGILGAGIIMDIFFLHQRGKAFAGYTLCQLFGALAGPTIGGLSLHGPKPWWPVQIWWTVGVEGAVIILVFLFLEETQFDRHHNHPSVHPHPRCSWLTNRLHTFFPGHRVLPANRQINSPLSIPLIFISPLTLLSGAILTLTFGWAVAVNTLLAVFLQSPTSAGGYAFTPTQNALFTFGQWLGLLVALAYDAAFNDRVPLWACRRWGHGRWKPEYRLFPLLVPPLLILPVGLGLFGAALQYHLHYLVLALADFLIIWAEHVLAPVIVNYVVENFTRHAAEATAVLNFYRLVLGVVVPFFVVGWEARVGGPGWVFGMMALLTLGASGCAGGLVVWGSGIRRRGFGALRESEEGVDLEIKGG